MTAEKEVLQGFVISRCMNLTVQKLERSVIYCLCHFFVYCWTDGQLEKRPLQLVKTDGVEHAFQLLWNIN